jgi:hypothetical protein
LLAVPSPQIPRADLIPTYQERLSRYNQIEAESSDPTGLPSSAYGLRMLPKFEILCIMHEGRKLNLSGQAWLPNPMTHLEE